MHPTQYSPVIHTNSLASWLDASMKMKVLPKMVQTGHGGCHCNVPKITMVIGGSLVQGTMVCVVVLIRHVSCGHANSRISVMGGEQASSVLSHLKT